MKSIIIYKSKYGATWQYAVWLAESLQVPIEDANDLSKEYFKNYDVFFIGTSVYFGKFKNAHWLRRNEKELGTKKKIFMFIVSTSANDPVLCNKFISTNVPAGIQNKCVFYFLPGRVLHKNLSPLDRLFLRLASLFEKDPVKKWALRNDLNEVKKENLVPIIVAAKCFLSKTA